MFVLEVTVTECLEGAKGNENPAKGTSNGNFQALRPDFGNQRGVVQDVG